MSVGALGEVVFVVSREETRTLSQFYRSRRAEYAEHQILDQKPHLQFTGVGLFRVSFRIKLTAGLCDPKEEAETLWKMQEAGKAYRLLLGIENMGRFAIEDMEEARKWVDPLGRPLVSEFSLSLKEYANG